MKNKTSMVENPNLPNEKFLGVQKGLAAPTY
jgi:hypothetical protein